VSICNGCGGVVGVDCFNPQECEWISRDMAQRWEGEGAQAVEEQREDERRYWAAQEAGYYAEMEVLEIVANDLGPSAFVGRS
jgi:hypothetical protein